MPELHRALMDIASLMNRPERDAQLLEIAGLTLERALFPLLVTVERRGPIGVVELADGVGRDYTTVSRQIARLEEIGLVERRASPSDKRVREAVITTKGKAATDAVDAAREKMVLSLFKDWKRDDFDELIRLMKMLADSMSAEPTRSE
ncbi:MarR family winged helix-turn-helix transcriptional regulator [Paracoccus denitrificans]|nr:MULTISPECIES: MarR family winged helix-turn-helix transcriptional regulator [Paracoccus]MBB4628268.1 DNA-binding MarR family transcriptional regulator [Paracoccus denitrificans]MCU7429330.1 MarR family winged helix-turn-helix transcriptional regulator [Paracoccus denitrificans]UPV97486.1 MarR family winged helix-turn-helix transcriptional regulator [Paracoccus denitrificans]WQO35399.1 MarR family winged helix-turn-helix transcriptional regulator [Paracoccus denitrificans]SDI88477.1 DNA-bind